MCVPTAISGGVDISDVPGCHFLWQTSYQRGSQKLLEGLVSHEFTAYISVFHIFLIQWIMAILSKRCKPDNFELHNSLKLSFTYICGIRSHFVECESWILLMWNWMGLFFRKNHPLRYCCWLSLLNWFWALKLSLLVKLPPRKLEVSYCWGCSESL